MVYKVKPQIFALKRAQQIRLYSQTDKFLNLLYIYDHVITHPSPLSLCDYFTSSNDKI